MDFVFSPSGLGLREFGARMRTPQRLPIIPPNSHQCHPCLASQVALGDRAGLEVPLSEMQKHHQVAAPHALPLRAPLVGPGVSLTEYTLLSVQRRARACAGACTTPLPTPLQTSSVPCHLTGPRGTTSEAHEEQRPHCVPLVEMQLWHHPRWVRTGQSLNSSPGFPWGLSWARASLCPGGTETLQ